MFTCSESGTCCPGPWTVSAIVPPPAPPGWSYGMASDSCPAPPFTYKSAGQSKGLIYTEEQCTD